MTINFAAWLKAPFAPLQVATAPFPEAREDEIVVRVRAVAVNPLERLIQKMGGFMYSWLKYPAVIGADLAGEVVSIGNKVTRFKLGDRVLALAVGVEKSRNRPSEGAFQTYAVVLEHLTSAIPPDMRFEDAAVLPLGLSTAASGMFQTDLLALDPPHADAVSNGKKVLIWGGSTSVGSNAIQLAVNAGYTVVATASPRNFDYVKALGASHVYDYTSRTVVRDIKRVLRGTRFAGAVAVGAGSAKACIDIVATCRGKKFVAIATFPVDFDKVPERTKPFGVALRVMPQMIPAMVGLNVSAALGGVKTKFIWGSSLMDNEVSKIIFADFLPQALASGAYRPAPPSMVIGEGLDAIQPALDRLRLGVSAQKIVVRI
jgi:NADPH:quinone reductase-like Zn-dependent oxidoreductase